MRAAQQMMGGQPGDGQQPPAQGQEGPQPLTPPAQAAVQQQAAPAAGPAPGAKPSTPSERGPDMLSKPSLTQTGGIEIAVPPRG